MTQDGRELTVEVKVEEIEGGELEKEGNCGVETFFETEKQKGKKRKHVFGKGSLEMLRNDAGETLANARVDWVGAAMEDNNEWNEALDISSSLSFTNLSSIGEDEKIPKSFQPTSKISDQLLKDFQELCCPDVKSC